METFNEVILARMADRAALLDLMLIMTRDNCSTAQREAQITLILEEQEKEITIIINALNSGE